MITTPARKKDWPKKIRLGRITVSIYCRKNSSGNLNFMLANYANGKRRFDSYPTEAKAMEAAHQLSRKMSERDVLGASMTREQSVDFAAAVQTLKPFSVSLTDAVSVLTQAIKHVGDLSSVVAAAKFYAARHKRTTPKPVKEVVAELLTIKQSRGASPYYTHDLRIRLNRFAADCQKDCCNVTTAEIQEWLDAQKFSSQGYTDYRRRLSTLFSFAVARGYASDNPVEGVEKIKVLSGNKGVFTPVEIAKLLATTSPDFLPCLALGGFAGLRSAEIERLEWSDIDLAGRHITVGADKAKTATRRIVPVSDNLAAWLASYAQREGMVWKGTHEGYYDAQQATAAAAGLKWKANALRHSYASYRFAQTTDAGRVAGELGNSAALVHRHYRELVKPADAERWFSIKPDAEANVVTMPVAVSA